MFIAPLNLDIFFKKAFSDKETAKKFFENMLNVRITSIKILATEKKLTDDSVVIKFDFRCKIDGKYVIIEMQQKYKVDVVKRFYLYHATSTALQLETLKPVKITGANGKTYTEKNYSGVEPVLTLIWMVDDMLGFKDDYVVFTTLPEIAKEFITDDVLWQQPLPDILKARDKAVKILENKAKGLDFFTENKIIYIFQKNIVNNQNINLGYFKYFDFANISKNPENKEEDFLKYKNDTDMAEMLRRLNKDNWSPTESKYVDDLMNYEFFMVRREESHRIGLARQKNRLEKKVNQAEQKAEQAEQKAEQERQKAEEAVQKAEQVVQKFIKTFLEQGMAIPKIAEELEMNLEEVEKLVELIQNNQI